MTLPEAIESALQEVETQLRNLASTPPEIDVHDVLEDAGERVAELVEQVEDTDLRAAILERFGRAHRVAYAELMHASC